MSQSRVPGGEKNPNRAKALVSLLVGLTAKALSCAARAHVTTAERHAACLHLKRAMQAA